MAFKRIPSLEDPGVQTFVLSMDRVHDPRFSSRKQRREAFGETSSRDQSTRKIASQLEPRDGTEGDDARKDGLDPEEVATHCTETHCTETHSRHPKRNPGVEATHSEIRDGDGAAYEASSQTIRVTAQRGPALFDRSRRRGRFGLAGYAARNTSLAAGLPL